MHSAVESCAVCGVGECVEPGMSRVVIEQRVLHLCREHATEVVQAMPATFAELRVLFAGLGGPDGARPRSERRSPIVRRDTDDRRVLPPRPEGRRASSGRRASDPMD